MAWHSKFTVSSYLDSVLTALLVFFRGIIQRASHAVLEFPHTGKKSQHGCLQDVPQLTQAVFLSYPLDIQAAPGRDLTYSPSVLCQLPIVFLPFRLMQSLSSPEFCSPRSPPWNTLNLNSMDGVRHYDLYIKLIHFRHFNVREEFSDTRAAVL